MKLIKTKFDGLFIIKIDRFDDERGYLSKFFDKDTFKASGINFNFTQVKYTYTKSKGTIRGMHFQTKPFEEDKIVRCIRGEVFEVVVDIRKKSKTYGIWFGKKFSEDDNESLLIPKGFAHGYQALTHNCEMLYLMSGRFSKENNAGYRWNDPHFKIEWPLKSTIIAKKDNNWPNFTF
jgi:dTDP-4-dehydrorhamnose 3,5-epimerase